VLDVRDVEEAGVVEIPFTDVAVCGVVVVVIVVEVVVLPIRSKMQAQIQN